MIRMAICKRRDRVVVFRVTDEEHHQLQLACETNGNRNLSEFVRLELLNRGQNRKTSRANIACLEKRLSDLEASYKRATEQIQGPAEQDASEADDLA